jgi:hypothetical protein
VLWPTARLLRRDELIRRRAVPVHPLGVVAVSAWADGGARSPAEFFWHDVDHARFKLREDLLVRGIAVQDAYVDGGTWDAANGRHRTFVAEALPHVGPWTWAGSRERAAFARELLAAIAALGDRDLAAAAQWLLFELVHEKSLPLVGAVLREALAGARHVDKLARKASAGFYADEPPPAAALARLDDARRWLGQQLGDAP